MKKILKWVLIILTVWIVLAILVSMSDDEEEEGTGNQTTTKMAEPAEKTAQADLSVSDFALNKDLSKALKTLRSKGWMPGDGDEGECSPGYSDFLAGYGYVKQGGRFEGYRVPFIIVSADEYGKLAHIRVTIESTVNSKDYEEATEKAVVEAKGEAIKEVEKLCLLRHGYSYSADEDEEDVVGNRYGSIVLGYKNGNGDVCKVEIIDTGIFTTSFTLDYVSARFRNEEKLAQEILNSYYGR